MKHFFRNLLKGKYEILDKFYDFLLYSLITLCFTGSGILIVRQVLNTNQNYLWQIGFLIGFGLLLSGVEFYLKSWSDK